MKNSDVELIHRILDGDDSAFSELVKKYQKPVHALVWRKIGDFHIAEEITQDTFLKAYQRLATLKQPQRFTGWLYVIATNNCKMWLRKKRLRTQSLEETSIAQLEKATYSGYVVEENERTIAEAQREVVKQLLATLQESDRTVITLHYFSDMSAADIGAFLGVSVNTIKSRLRRAQQRLKQEEPMVREALEHFQITPHLTENIMREISRLKPVAPSGSKPLIPLTVSAATALFIFLIIGVGSQHLVRFQKPYNIDAQSETTVEIIEAPIVLDRQVKPDLRNQAGRFETTGKRNSAGPQLSAPVAPGAARIAKEARPSSQQQWVQASGPSEVSATANLFLSSQGDVYVSSPVGIYRSTPQSSTWTLINASVPIKGSTPMAERDGMLYLAATREVFVSIDKGETWESLGERPRGYAIGLVGTGEGLYLALDNQVFRWTDAGKQWIPLNEKIEDGIVFAIAAIENTVFVGTTQGLYRVQTATWEKLPMDTTKAIHSLAVSENNLYVGTGPDIFQFETSEAIGKYMGQFLTDNTSRAWEIFHSIDLGNSWTDITPASNSIVMRLSPGIKVLVSGETLLALGMIGTLRSTDAGKTWTELGTDALDVNSTLNAAMSSVFPAVLADKNTLFKTGFYGPTRSTDGGQSWHPFIKGMVGTRINNLMAFRNHLYINTGSTIAKSADGGESWRNFSVDYGELTPKPAEASVSTDFLINAKLAISDDMLYVIVPKAGKENEMHIFHLSANGSVLLPIQGALAFDRDLATEPSDSTLQKVSAENITDNIVGDAEKADVSTEIARRTAEAQQTAAEWPRGFAVSGETFYVEYKRRLFRWRRGELEWFNTGLIDKVGLSDDIIKSLRDRGTDGRTDRRNNDLKLAVLGETVYVGKRDGHLFRSLDGGGTWKDLTSNLPLRFARINEIVFAGLTVYVATDAGVLTSQDGEHWRGITDKTGVNTVIDRMAVTGTAVYGVGSSGAHRLDNRGEWEKISPEVPDKIIAATINGNRLYVATQGRGMFHISLENESN